MRDAATPQPTLSVCIITRDRCDYLKKTIASLQFLEQLPFTSEIIVSDNCSADATTEVVEQARQRIQNLRYFRQSRDVGPDNNLISAFRMAVGEFIVYLADDDALVPDALASVIAFMRENADVCACYAPWELYDDVDKKSLGLFYKVEQVEHFEREDALLLFDFIVSRHVFPEIAVYRSTAAHRILYRPHKAYWAYVYLARLLDHGAIAFLPYAFYRSVTRHWEGEVREQGGHRQAMSDGDLFRGGLEFLLRKALTCVGRDALPEQERSERLKAINHFMGVRMKVALRLFAESGDFVSAFDVYQRLMAWGYLGRGDVAWCRTVLTPPRSHAVFHRDAECGHSPPTSLLVRRLERRPRGRAAHPMEAGPGGEGPDRCGLGAGEQRGWIARPRRDRGRSVETAPGRNQARPSGRGTGSDEGIRLLGSASVASPVWAAYRLR